MENSISTALPVRSVSSHQDTFREGSGWLLSLSEGCPGHVSVLSVPTGLVSGGEGRETHQPPPQGISIGLKLLFHLLSLGIHFGHILLHQVDKKRRKDEC